MYCTSTVSCDVSASSLAGLPSSPFVLKGLGTIGMFLSRVPLLRINQICSYVVNTYCAIIYAYIYIQLSHTNKCDQCIDAIYVCTCIRSYIHACTYIQSTYIHRYIHMYVCAYVCVIVIYITWACISGKSLVPML